MIIQHFKVLSTRKIILASSSPRRQSILTNVGLAVEVIPSTFEENLNPKDFSHASEYVKCTAKRKTEEVVEKCLSSNKCVDLVIGADTCVTLDGEIIGKPKSRQDAIAMLTRLSGKDHQVITGVCLMYQKGNVWQDFEFHETTLVKFAPLSLDLIEHYVDTGEPMDKAGGYGIQGFGGTLVEGIKGDYFNVMGFPLHRFTVHLLPIIETWTKSSSSS